ncbi:hypothetical protein WICMUC_002030 [Wickerhamomyces mucosus]|uniref:Zn(2)-C6 fungal-type domain-containing protein n=1 Tax=Wickerhamomyces mucosus TaxID=1378264 RepID=A0A9P8TF12_9ASCO|nr:hypothetical protein WICMUC_002030 [Wickerhamomyces mucosus]
MPTTTTIRKRVSKACDCCRFIKLKCDGLRPCSRCLSDNKICTYMSKKIDSSSPIDKKPKILNASYVDILENRVSLLIQSMNQILEKCSSPDPKDLIKFCQDKAMKDEGGNFDLNRVILKLIPGETLENLMSSSNIYSINQFISEVKNNVPVKCLEFKGGLPDEKHQCPKKDHHSEFELYPLSDGISTEITDNYLSQPLEYTSDYNTLSPSSLSSSLTMDMLIDNIPESDQYLQNSYESLQSDIFMNTNIDMNQLDMSFDEQLQDCSININDLTSGDMIHELISTSNANAEVENQYNGGIFNTENLKWELDTVHNNYVFF